MKQNYIKKCAALASLFIMSTSPIFEAQATKDEDARRNMSLVPVVKKQVDAEAASSYLAFMMQVAQPAIDETVDHSPAGVRKVSVELLSEILDECKDIDTWRADTQLTWSTYLRNVIRSSHKLIQDSMVDGEPGLADVCFAASSSSLVSRILLSLSTISETGHLLTVTNYLEQLQDIDGIGATPLTLVPALSELAIESADLSDGILSTFKQMVEVNGESTNHAGLLLRAIRFGYPSEGFTADVLHEIVAGEQPVQGLQSYIDEHSAAEAEQ